MADVYEFHVAGLVGPVVRAALSELTSHDEPPTSVLTGTASSPAEVDDVLKVLHDHGLSTDRILLTRQDRWHPADRAGPATG